MFSLSQGVCYEWLIRYLLATVPSLLRTPVARLRFPPILWINNPNTKTNASELTGVFTRVLQSPGRLNSQRVFSEPAHELPASDFPRQKTSTGSVLISRTVVIGFGNRLLKHAQQGRNRNRGATAHHHTNIIFAANEGGPGTCVLAKRPPWAVFFCGGSRRLQG